MVAIAFSRATLRPDRHSVWRTAIALANHLVIRSVTIGHAEVTKAFGLVTAGRAAASVGTKAGMAAGHGAESAGKSMVSSGAGAIGTLRCAAENLGKRVRRPMEDTSESKQTDGAPPGHATRYRRNMT